MIREEEGREQGGGVLTVCAVAGWETGEGCTGCKDAAVEGGAEAVLL